MLNVGIVRGENFAVCSGERLQDVAPDTVQNADGERNRALGVNRQFGHPVRGICPCGRLRFDPFACRRVRDGSNGASTTISAWLPSSSLTTNVPKYRPGEIHCHVYGAGRAEGFFRMPAKAVSWLRERAAPILRSFMSWVDLLRVDPVDAESRQLSPIREKAESVSVLEIVAPYSERFFPMPRPSHTLSDIFLGVRETNFFLPFCAHEIPVCPRLKVLSGRARRWRADTGLLLR